MTGLSGTDTEEPLPHLCDKCTAGGRDVLLMHYGGVLQGAQGGAVQQVFLT